MSVVEPLFTKNSDPNGPEFIHDPNPIAGAEYYVRRTSDSGAYFVKHTFQPIVHLEGAVHLTTYSASNTEEEESLYEVTLNPLEIEEARGVHLLVTITAMVFPTLTYLIGFPISYNKYKHLVRKLGSPSALQSKFKIYSVFGWISWFFHLALLISLCTFWVPTECYTDLENHSHCGMSYKAVVAVVVIWFSTFVATILIMSIGTRCILALRRYTPGLMSPISTDQVEGYGSL
jgi:type III secretory pathway component EscU